MIITVNAKDIKALTDLRDQIRRELETVESTLAIANRRLAVGGGAPIPGNGSPAATSRGQAPSRKYGAVTKSVLEAIGLCLPEFQFSNVENALAESLKHPLEKEQISLAINRLIKQGKIEVSKPRHGRTPAIYKKM